MNDYIISHCPFCLKRFTKYTMEHQPIIQFWCPNYGEHKCNLYYDTNSWDLRNLDISQGKFNIKINFKSWGLNHMGTEISRRVQKTVGSTTYTDHKETIVLLPHKIIHLPLLTMTNIIPYIESYVIFS